MINIKDLKKNFDQIRKHILDKDPAFPIDKLWELYNKRNTILQEISLYNEKINVLSNNVKIGCNDHHDVQLEVKDIKKKQQILQKDFEKIEQEFNLLALSCPNIIFDDVPLGTKNENFCCRTFSHQPQFSFQPKNHLELLTIYSKDTIAFGSKISKGGFYAYEDKIAWLIYRLAFICLKYNEKNGFRVLHIPQVANYETIKNAGNLPRFTDELFFIANMDLILIPTAEVVLASYCQDRIYQYDQLPVRITSWTRCYRKEVGGYGANERGLIRIHEFEKIELFSFTSEDRSQQELEYMVKLVEGLLQLFNIHYKVMLLASQDCSFSSAKTYDIEIWLPGQNQYKEVSSISNCTDFQARRSNTKYVKNGKNYLMHTLNGSSLALPRLMVALIENWQNKDGIDFDGLFHLLSEIEQKIETKLHPHNSIK